MKQLEKITSMQTRLDKIASQKTKIWWDRYLRNTVEFRGVNFVCIREELHKWYKSEKINTLSETQQLDLALSFFSGRFAEDKLTGVLFLQEYLSKILIGKFLYRKLKNFSQPILSTIGMFVIGSVLEFSGQ
jgi:hypothetical protein